MRKIVEKASWYAFLCLMVFLGFFAGWNPFQKEIPVYHVFCTGNLQGAVCDSEEETAGITTYRADAATQAVIYWSESGEPMKHEHCIVRDERNWVCAYYDKASDTFRKYRMLNGTYSVDGNSPFLFEKQPGYKWHNTTKAYWWLTNLAETFR